MYRRTFLTAGLATLATGGHALAQMKMDDMNAMPGMDHSGHGMAAEPAKPAASLVLKEGETLRELPRLANQATETGLFRANLVAAPATAHFAVGVETPVLAYNGMTPGPLIEAFEGDRIEIDFVNDIPGEDSTIHWHGMPVPADQDGNPMDPVASGATRRYAFDLPAGSAASYWFHPHPHGKTAEQVYRGLAGVFLVRSKADPIPAAYGDTVLVFTDLRLGADGSIPENSMVDLMNGRVGDHILVNGQKNPALDVPLGAKRRFRLYNATNARFLKLSFGAANIVVIGSDGGLLETPVAVEDVLLAPAERLELVVSFDKPGAMQLETLAYERGWMGPGKPDDAGLALLTVNVSGAAGEPMPPLPEKLRAIAALGPTAINRRFVFTEKMGMGASGMEMGFFINDVAFDMKRVDIVAKAGEVELWEVVNKADMDHPFHVHGTQFQVVEHERDGKVTAPAYRAWKDTVNVAQGETVRLLLKQDLPGQRMYHCHILEHEQLGMMGIVDVTV
ncbi:copper oxidase [Mesorhizobium loti]|nr:multicopper oxidase family protein [Mesorhizobium loti]PLP61178.1 copper oxidase [Mesorhizobium loti]